MDQEAYLLCAFLKCLKDKRMNLDEALKKIKGLETELEGLVSAVKSLTFTDDISFIFEDLLRTMQSVLDYEDAFILFEHQKGVYTTHYCTHEEFLQRSWIAKDLFLDVEKGNAHISNNVSHSEEWNQHLDLLTHVKSALHFPLIGDSNKAIFICTKNEEGFFTKEHLAIVSHFIPFTNYTLKLLEINENLQNEILQREKIEGENKRLQATVVDTAYKEGFAENAISVLHNIGNLTTPLRLKLEAGQEISELEKIKQVIDKIAQIDGAEQRKEVADKLIEILEKNDQQFKEIIDFGLEQTKKISTTISSQQKYANLKNKVKTQVDLVSVINDAIYTHQSQFEKYNINNMSQLMDKAIVTTERNGIHHVITNMITNSIEAINERTKHFGDFSDKYIYLSIHEAGDEFVITLKDNGIGITEEDKEKLFNFGYTTKDDGSGFGLHNSANFIGSQGGRLELESKGQNEGATCTLYIPKVSKDN